MPIHKSMLKVACEQHQVGAGIFIFFTYWQTAMKFAPERKKFMEIMGGSTDDLDADIQKFCTIFPPLLEENHKFLVSHPFFICMLLFSCRKKPHHFVDK